MLEYDFPPGDDEYIEEGIDSPDSEKYAPLRKWVSYAIRHTFRIHLKRSETSLEWLRMSSVEKNAIKYAPDLLPPHDLTQRMEDNIIAMCAQWITTRIRQLSDQESNVLKSLCNVPIDIDILLQGLLLLTKAREAGLLFFKDETDLELRCQ